jgi:hypothetical protein
MGDLVLLHATKAILEGEKSLSTMERRLSHL